MIEVEKQRCLPHEHIVDAYVHQIVYFIWVTEDGDGIAIQQELSTTEVRPLSKALNPNYSPGAAASTAHCWVG